MELTEQLQSMLVTALAVFTPSLIVLLALVSRETNNKENNKYIVGITIGSIALSLLTIVITAFIASVFVSNDPTDHPHTDTVKTVYTNNMGATVTYEVNGEIYTGGKPIEKTGKSDKNHTLTATKGKAKLNKKVKYYQIIGDNTGIIGKIEYGKRTWTAKVFGFTLATHTEPVVKIYFDEEEPENKKALEKLLGEN